MSKRNKFLVVLVILGVMNFKVLVSATKNTVETENKNENCISEESDGEFFNSYEEEEARMKKYEEEEARMKKIAIEKENEKKEQKLKEMNDKNVKIVLKNSEILEWVKLWIDIWGGNLIDLCANKEKITLEEIKEYIKGIVRKEIEGFDKILDRFKGYEFNFQNIKPEEMCEFEKKTNEIIEKENEIIEKEYGVKILEEIVFDFIYNIYRYMKKGELSDEILDKKIKEKEEEKRKSEEELSNNMLSSIEWKIIEINELKKIKKVNKKSNYKQLIRNAYERYSKPTYLKWYDKQKYKGMLKSNLNIYKFNRAGYNSYEKYSIDDGEGEYSYTSWKKGKYDIYSEESIEEIEKEYKEIQFILEIKNILEEMKKIDEEKIFKICDEMSKQYSGKISFLGPNGYYIVETWKELPFIDETIKRCFEVLEYKLKSNLSLEKRFQYYEFNKFLEILKQFIESGLFKQIISEIIDLTKEEYYPKRFIENFKNLMKYKYAMLDNFQHLKEPIETLLERIKKNKLYWKDIRWKLRDFGGTHSEYVSFNSYKKVFKNSEGIKYIRDFYGNVYEECKKIFDEKKMVSSVFDYCYIYLLKELISKYKLIFFEKIKKMGDEGVFKALEKAKKIAKKVKKLKITKFKKENIDDLIKEIGVNDNKEGFSELFNSDSEEGFEVRREILIKMKRFINDYKLEDLLNIEYFFEQLKKIVETSCDLHNKESKINEIKKQLKRIVIEKPIYPKETIISKAVLKRIVNAFEGLFEEENIKANFKHKTSKLLFPRLKVFFERIIYLIEYSYNEKEFMELFNNLIKKMEKYLLFAEIKDKENEQLTKYLKEDEEKKDDVNKEEYNYDYDDYDDYYNYDDYEENARRTI